LIGHEITGVNPWLLHVRFSHGWNRNTCHHLGALCLEEDGGREMRISGMPPGGGERAKTVPYYPHGATGALSRIMSIAE
jgi:hypothetical protein